MSRAHDCKLIREQLFDYRRGELSPLDAAQFEATLDACPDCQRHARRLIDLLDLASEAPAQDWTEQPMSSPDDLFAAIAAQLGQPAVASAPKPPPVQLLGPLAGPSNDDLEDEDEQLSTPPRSLAPWLLIIAAAACALIVAPRLLRDAALNSPDQGQLTAIDLPPRLDTLSAQPANLDAVKVFASEGTSWSLDHQGRDYTVRLDRGTLLIEFLPRAGESMRVISRDTEVEVIGTVFFVQTPEDQDASQQTTQVGVFDGAVRVKNADRQPTILKKGQRLTSGAQVQALETPPAISSLVDLDAHRAALDAAKAIEPPAPQAQDPAPPTPTPQEEPPKDTSAPQPARTTSSREPDSERVAPKPSAAELRRRAADALSARRYDVAAQEYERLLNQTPESSQEAATLRLELARLYMRELNRPDRATQHLRTFIKLHPSDVAAPSARRQLCRLLGPDAPECQP